MKNCKWLSVVGCRLVRNREKIPILGGVRGGFNFQSSIIDYRFKSARGYVLGMVMLFFVIFSTLGLAFIKMGGFERIATLRHYQRTKAFYYAEAGIHKGMWRLNHVGVESATFTDSTVSVICDTLNKTMIATGHSGTIQRSVKATLTSSSPYRISKWERL